MCFCFEAVHWNHPQRNVIVASITLTITLMFCFQKCADHKVSDKDLYPTFARTFPPATQVTRSIVALLLHFHWQKFTIIVGSSDRWQGISQKLEELSAEHNLTVNAKHVYSEPHMIDRTGNPFPRIIADSYIDTRSKYR